MSDVEIMDKSRLAQLSFIILFCLAGCDISPEDTGLTSSSGLVNKGVMSNAEVTAYKAGTLEFVKRTYTNSDGTFVFENLDYQGVIYVEVTTTSQTLSTCDATTGCGEFKDGLKLPGEYDKNLNGVVDFGDIHYYNDPNFKLTSFINPNFNDLENFGEFAVTPLTHIAAQRIISEGVGTATGVDTINAQVAELFGLEGVDITRLVPPDVTDEDKMSNATDAERMYSTLNAAVASSVTNTKDLVSVISELTDSFVNDGGLVGNSSNSEATTLATLQGLAEDVADTVESDLGVNMDAVQQKIQQEESENLSATPDALIEPVVTIEDSDGDGLTDTQENEIGTNPDLADTDSDGMTDGWEYLNSLDPTLNSDGSLDNDRDNLSNLQEFNLNTNPQSADTDGDLMLDGWEYLVGLNPLSNLDALLDPDSDSLTNVQEHSNGTNPFQSDSDSDGMPDDWEISNGLNANSNADASTDKDNDGLNNLQEFTLTTNPQSSDTDGDMMLDMWEYMNGLDPLLASDSGLDPDADTLTNLQEHNLGTDPFQSDSDFDGMPDNWEIDNALNPLFSSDAFDDFDVDGLTNAQEYITGTDPSNSNSNSDAGNILDGDEDTDGDGLQDKYEFLVGTDPVNEDTDGDLTLDGADSADGDDIPDELEVIEGLALGQDDYAVDFDGDTVSNGDEFQNGSNVHYKNSKIHYISNADTYSNISDSYAKKLLLLNETEIFINSDDVHNQDKAFLYSQSDVNNAYDGISHNISSDNYRLIQPYLDSTSLPGGTKFLDATPDGRIIVFSTSSDKVISGEGGINDEVYIVNRMTGSVISLDHPNEFDNGVLSASISADGRYLAFNSIATNVTDDTDMSGVDVFLKDLSSPAIDPVLVTRSTVANTTANSSSYDPQISANGQRIIFSSFATDLDAINASSDTSILNLYVYDVATSVMKRITKAEGNDAVYDIGTSKISADGKSVIYETQRDMLANDPGGSSYAKHLYYLNLEACFPSTVMDCLPILITHEEGSNGYSDVDNGEVGIASDLSSDGRYVVYISDGSNLDSGHGPSSSDPQIPLQEIYLWDRESNENRLVSQYLYNSAGNFQGSTPENMWLGGILATSDFSRLYITYGNAGLFTDSLLNCPAETDCLYKVHLGIEQTDSDSDGLNDRQELAMGTNAFLSDTDGDGLSDGDEINIHKTSPLLSDSDEDGIADNIELNGNTSPIMADTDSDLLSDFYENNTSQTDPLNSDSDGDGMLDGWEVYLGRLPGAFNADALSNDADADGLTDFEEFNDHYTDPLNSDSDGDGHTDSTEIDVYGSDPNDPNSVPEG